MARFVKLEDGSYLNIDVISRIKENTVYTIGEQNPSVLNLTGEDVVNILDAAGYFKNGYSK